MQGRRIAPVTYTHESRVVGSEKRREAGVRNPDAPRLRQDRPRVDRGYRTVRVRVAFVVPKLAEREGHQPQGVSSYR